MEPDGRRAARLRDDAPPRRAGGAQPGRSTSPTSARSTGRAARPIGRSWSSASATSWATGASCLLTPFGGRVHAPWAMAIEARLREHHGLDVQTIWTDDGIAVRLPEADRDRRRDDRSTLLLDPDEIEELLTAELGGSALFAARFRENAARALLLPRRRPGQRTPLWMQRQKSADLLSRRQPLRLVPDHARDVPRGAARRLRPARAAWSCSAASGRASSGS